jgi:hypothetical protein
VHYARHGVHFNPAQTRAGDGQSGLPGETQGASPGPCSLHERALQEVALALVQASVDDAPFGIEVGDADNVTAGGVWPTACPVINSGETSKTSLKFRNIVLRNMIFTYSDCNLVLVGGVGR